MKSFKEYLRLNESIVDQYIEVRKQAILGDQLVHKFKSTSNQVPSSLISYIPPVRPPEIIPNTRTGISHDGEITTHYSMDFRRALTDLRDVDLISNNSHELAHAYQHQAQIRDNTRRFQLSPSEQILSVDMSPFDNNNPLWKLNQKIKQMKSLFLNVLLTDIMYLILLMLKNNLNNLTMIKKYQMDIRQYQLIQLIRLEQKMEIQ